MFSKLKANLSSAFSKKKLEENDLENIQESLILADVSFDLTEKIKNNLKNQKIHQDNKKIEVKELLKSEITKILKGFEGKFEIKTKNPPFVILICGVNGSGKTTAIGKLADKYQKQGLFVTLAACDTFRAGAAEQLKKWAEKTDTDILSFKEKQDPASAAYDAYKYAKENGSDVLIIDTAGRMHSNESLMKELEKISNVVKKFDDSLPNETLLVLDTTSGQNIINQTEFFKQYVNISGLVLNKLDSTSKGGAVLSLAEKHKIPIVFAGIGEKIDDLKDFEINWFVNQMLD